MEIVDRSSAIKLSLIKYYTGKLCRNGHLAERYTQSGVCLSCLRTSNRYVRTDKVELEEDIEARNQLVKRRAAILEGLTDIRVLARPGEDLNAVYELAYAMCKMRYPDILEVDARGKRDWVRNTPMYSITVPREDEQTVRDAASVLWRKIAPDFTPVKQRLQVAMKEAGDEPPAWTEKP